MGKKIALHGAHRVDNFGDSLFVVYFYRWLKETIDIDDEDIILPFANERVRRLVKVSNIKGLSGLLRSDKIVFIGGGYLGERPNKKLIWNIRLLTRHISIGLLAVIKKKPFTFIGVGAGPLTNPISRKLTVFICNKSEKVIVRDEESKKYLLDYGVKEGKIKETADSILLLQESDVDTYWNEKYKKELTDNQSSKTTYIGVHLQASSNNIEKLKAIISDIEKYCNGLKNYRIVVFNDTYKEKPNSTALNLFLERFAEEKIINIDYINPDQLIALINNLDIVITTKLHCGIVANCLGKYTLSISVHNKTTRLYKQLGIEKRQILINDYKNCDLIEMLSDYGKVETKNNVPGKLRQLAEENKQELIKFIR